MIDDSSIFKHRRILIASKHQKEIVFLPLLQQAFQAEVKVAELLDTDQLGTFSGEIERVDDPLTTLRHKCQQALALYPDEELVLASEGSFGAHPYLFFVAADEEWLMLYDKKYNIEIIAKEISMETNFNGKEIQSLSELAEFADQCLFPSHRLIVRNKDKGTDYIQKGIGDKKALESFFKECMALHGSVFVETDMRAMYNPSRLKVITTCMQKLLEKMASKCPKCQYPGFSITDAVPGLPCSQCKNATRSTLYHQAVCTNCAYKEEYYFPHQKNEENPMYCDYCNP